MRCGLHATGRGEWEYRDDLEKETKANQEGVPLFFPTNSPQEFPGPQSHLKYKTKGGGGEERGKGEGEKKD